MHYRISLTALTFAATLLLCSCGDQAGAGAARQQSWKTHDSDGATSVTGGAIEQPASLAVVDVSGAVRRPGVYRLPKTARVLDAIAAAGGGTARADYTALNRAAPLVDGQQIVISTVAGGEEQGVGESAAEAGAAHVSLNTADETALQELPGIGPVTAAAIVADRTAHGPFGSVDDLDRVQGIGSATITALRDVATV